MKKQEVQVFDNEALGSVRVIGDSENPLFCLSDICKILGIQNSRHLTNKIKDEFEGCSLKLHPLQTAGGLQNFTFITEAQLYFVLMRSDKPKAKAFRQWIINKILPTIRKQGFYSPNEYISELANILIQHLPPYDFLVKIYINDFNNKKEFSFGYSVGDAKFKLKKKNCK